MNFKTMAFYYFFLFFYTTHHFFFWFPLDYIRKNRIFSYLSTVHSIFGISLVAQMEKNLPAMRETGIQSLGWEDPLQKGMATHSSILAWRIPWTEEPGRLHSPWGHKESDTTEQLIHTHTYTHTHTHTHTHRAYTASHKRGKKVTLLQ